MEKAIKTEKELVRLVLKGNIKLFEEIINRYQRLVLSIAMRFTNNHYDREEVCQEIFIKVYQNLSGFNFNSKLSTWIGKVAYNHCINYVNKNSKFLSTDSFEKVEDNNNQEFIEFRQINLDVTINTDFEEKEIFTLVNECMYRLPMLYQTILNLFHIQEMSYKEISEILVMPEGTVKSYLYRSRKLLKEKLLSSYKEEELV